MEDDLPKSGAIDRIGEALLGRLVVGICVLAVLAICLVAGNYVQVTLTQLRKSHATFNDLQLRNGFVAMSDVQRLVLILHEAVSLGQMTAESSAEFQSAADFLYVRTDNFRRVLDEDEFTESAVIAIAELEEVQAIADHALASGFADLGELSADLAKKSQEARQALVTYLDDMRRFQDRLLQKQAQAVERQRAVVWGTLAGLSLLGIVAIVLLRREVIAKQARYAAEQRVRHLAFFDPMTGLPNRFHFQDRLGLLLERRATIALLLVDLDGFKLINDTHGHSAGDAILKHVAGQLNNISKRQNGFASRLGGDEFSIFVQTDDMPVLIELCRSIIADVSKPIMHHGESLSVSASIGVAISSQIGSEIELTLDSLSRVADFALYASKANGKKQFTIYDEALEQKFLDRRAMVEELPRAISDGSIDFFLQPKVELADGFIYGFEALVRWRRQGKIVPPVEFISTAEESGLIADIDFCVLRAATKDLAAFNFAHGTRFSVSVNFSTLHFSSPRFVDNIAEALRRSGLPPELLVVEMTETVEMQDWEQAKQVIAGLHALGVKVSIDDFGAGFSSLAYLRTTVADEIKIDRSLVEDIETSDRSRFLLDSVLEIARNLDLEVTVEGIETRHQAEIIAAMGAQNGQGYYFGRPLPKEEALALAFAQMGSMGQRSAS